MPQAQESEEIWKKSILSVIKGESKKKEECHVKSIRKLVLLSLQLDEDDKSAKKQYKRTIQSLQDDGSITLDGDGVLKLSKKRKSLEKKAKKEKKKKRKSSTKEELNDNDVDEAPVDNQEKNNDDDNDQNDNQNESNASKDEETNNNNELEQNETPSNKIDKTKKNKPCKGNPQGITRLFLGNLPFKVDEKSLKAFLPGTVEHIKWITDQETGKFYGSAFIEIDTSLSAAEAVAMAGTKLMGRPIKINFAPARPGDIWPPQPKQRSSTSGQAGGKGIKAMSAKPEHCIKLFIGNVSFDIDDDAIIKFFSSVDAEVRDIRWLHHDNGDFKGCGFVQFWKTDACERAATLNGKILMGRPIRIDWTE